MRKGQRGLLGNQELLRVTFLTSYTPGSDPSSTPHSCYCQRIVILKVLAQTQAVGHTLLIPAIGRQRQVELFEFKASLVYVVSSRTTRIIVRLSRKSTSPQQKSRLLMVLPP